MRPRTFPALCGVSLLLAAFCSVANAQLIDWTNASGDSNWFNPANWSTGAIPSATDQLYLDTGGLTHGGLVDLARGVASIQSMGIYSGSSATGYTVSNGTLVLDWLWDSTWAGEGSHSNNWIAASLATNSATLNLDLVQVSGVIGGSGGVGRNDFSLNAGGLLTGANTYTGTTTAGLYGPLTFSGPSGSAANSSAITLVGTLHLDNTAAVNTNRLSSTATISSNSGTFIYEGNATAASAESFGVFGLETGATQLTVLSHGPTAAATFQSLARVAGTTLNLTLTPTTGAPAGHVFIQDPASAPLVGGNGPSGSATVSILPFAISPGPQISFVTNDAGPDGVFGTADDVGLRPLNVFTEYAASIASGTNTAQNVRVTSPQTVSDSTTVNSLIVSGATVAVAGGKQLSIGSGAVALDGNGSNPSVITGGPLSSLAFGANPAIFHVVAPQFSGTNALVDLPITGSGGLVKSGFGSLVLSHPNSYTGGTYINQGTLVSGSQGALSSGPITVASATLAFQSENQTLTNTISVSSEFMVDVPGGIEVTLAGPISGTGYLEAGDNGTLRVTGPVNLVGGISRAGNFNGSGNRLYLDGVVTAQEVQVSGPSVLGGTGVIRAPVYLEDWGPVLAPGDNGPGILTVQSVSTNAGNATFQFALDGTQAGTEYSQLVVEDAPQLFSLDAELQLVLGYSPEAGDSFTIVRNLSDQPWDQAFMNLPEGTIFTADSQEFQITYHGGAGNDIVVTAVPEPVAFGSLIVGLALLCRRGRGSR